MASLWLRFLSFFYPVTLRRDSTAFNPDLELCLYRGRYQLGTADTLYSDGAEYRPLLEGFASIKSDLPHIRSVLVLGTGLASAVHILHRMKLYPFIRLVEIDPTVLKWAVEFLPEQARPNVDPVAADAIEFIATETDHYDMIIVDIFFGRVVPEAATEEDFFIKCRARLNKNGRLIMNYMLHDKPAIQRLKTTLEAVFAQVEEIGFGPNRVFIVRKDPGKS